MWAIGIIAYSLLCCQVTIQREREEGPGEGEGGRLEALHILFQVEGIWGRSRLAVSCET